MPVLSPHRSSSSSLSGSYRSNLGLDRPFYSSASTYSNPRISHHSYRTSSYSDSDGRRIVSRSGSITEDGVTTRFYEESREGSTSRRESNALRESSVDSSPSRRDSSLTRTDRLSTLSVLDSVAEMRNKYSPANYVPAILRNKNNSFGRSKSINDIGLPPIEKSSGSSKKVNDIVPNSNNSNTSVSDIVSNNTNTTKINPELNLILNNNEDDNGNRASVADLRKKFDDISCAKPPTRHVNGAVTNVAKPKNLETHEQTNKKTPTNSLKKLTVNGVSRSKIKNEITESAATPVIQKSPKNSQHQGVHSKQSSKFEVNGCEGNNGLEDQEKDDLLNVSSSRINHFSSYIPYNEKNGKDDTDDTLNNEESMENGKENSLGKLIVPNDVGITSKLSNRTPISPSPSRRSTDREISYRRRPTSDDFDGLRPTANAATATAGRVLGLNGLKNIGNTCFMNSVIQCLSNTRLLLEYLRKDLYLKDVNTATSQKGALIKAFAEVIKEVWSEDSSDRVVNTVSLKSQIQRFAPRFMGYAQQDAQEFLRYLLEGLHEDVNRVVERPKPIVTEIDDKLSDSDKSSESWSRYLRMDNSKIVDIFVGQLKSTLRCTHCGHCSVTFDPFWDLSLPIPQRTGPLRLQQCLDSFTREETLDGDEKPTCSKCKERRKCTKSFTIQKFPKILVIHLKRFSPTERFRGKLNVTIDFPLEGLDVSGYAADGIAPCRYTLYAVSNHSGTTYSGHYTAYCRHPYNNSWHEYNDSRVSSVSSKSVVSSEAYVLFYEQEGTKSHL